MRVCAEQAFPDQVAMVWAKQGHLRQKEAWLWDQVNQGEDEVADFGRSGRRWEVRGGKWGIGEWVEHGFEVSCFPPITSKDSI